MRPSDGGWTVAVLLAGIRVLVLSGCSTAIDTSRRNLTSVGAGWGRLNADNPLPLISRSRTPNESSTSRTPSPSTAPTRAG